MMRNVGFVWVHQHHVVGLAGLLVAITASDPIRTTRDGWQSSCGTLARSNSRAKKHATRGKRSMLGCASVRSRRISSLVTWMGGNSDPGRCFILLMAISFSGGGRSWIVVVWILVREHGGTNQWHDVGCGSRNAFDSDDVHATCDEVRHLIAYMETNECRPQW